MPDLFIVSVLSFIMPSERDFSHEINSLQHVSDCEDCNASVFMYKPMQYLVCLQDGRCNNLGQPTWGSSLIPHLRYVPPAYGDGIGAPRLNGVNGKLAAL